MKLKVIAGAIAIIASVSSCKKDEPKQESAKDTTKHSTIQSPQTLIDSFKQNKNEKAFLTSLYKKLGQEPKDDKGTPYRLIKIEEIKLHGSDNLYTLAYVDKIDGAMSGWPWKQLFILNEKGQIKGNYLTQKYEPCVIFENQSPLLMITEEKSKANGIHHFIGIDKDSIKEYLNSKEWKIQTIDGNNYSPKILPFELKDINNDKQKDIIFSGKKNKKPFTMSFVWDPKKENFELDQSKK